MAEKGYETDGLNDTNGTNPKPEQRYKEVTALLNPKLSGGPQGLGDPNDDTLRKVEQNVIIPKKVKERAKNEKCRDQYRTLAYCAREHGMFVIMRCKSEARKLERCLKHWISNEEFVQETKDQYLEDRRFYRTTGISRKEMKIVDALLDKQRREKVAKEAAEAAQGVFDKKVPS